MLGSGGDKGGENVWMEEDASEESVGQKARVCGEHEAVRELTKEYEKVMTWKESDAANWETGHGRTRRGSRDEVLLYG